MHYEDDFLEDKPADNLYGGLPHTFSINWESFPTGLNLDDAMAAMVSLRGADGIYSIYQSNSFIVLRELPVSVQARHDYQAGFALMAHGIRLGLQQHGEALPRIPDELETVARYEQLSRTWRSIFLQDRIKTALCYNELDLLVAVDSAAPHAVDPMSGRTRDMQTFWDGAVDAYMILAQAAADENMVRAGSEYLD